VFSRETGEQTRDLLRGVIVSGTGVGADPGNGEFAAGKTGTTENYGDAWFVGFTNRYTIAVWVGYPDRTRYMRTEFRGEPVAGGTFPAEIWRDFLLSADRLEQERNPKPVAPTAPVPGLGTAGSGEADESTATATGTEGDGVESSQDETPYDPDPTPYGDESSSTPATSEDSSETDESSSETDSARGY
jgi:penicillin-binding protein 1A